MASSSLHIILYNWLKPFLELAKSKGFHVSPDTHIQILSVLSQCADTIEDENVLFDYLSPLIAKNKEDYLLLKKEWEKWCGREKLILDKKTPVKKRKQRYRWLAVAIVCVLALIGAWWLLQIMRKAIIADYTISHTDITQPVRFDATQGFERIADTAKVMFVWNFGDGEIKSTRNAVVEHTYKLTGTYTTSVKLEARSSGVQIERATAKKEETFVLCIPPLSIRQEPDDNIALHEQVTFSVAYNLLYPSSGKTQWKINGKTVTRNTSIFSTQFDSAGTYSITYTDAGYAAGSNCDSTAELDVTIKPASTVNFAINQTGSAITPPSEVNNNAILILLCLLFCLFVFYYYNRRKIKNSGAENTYRSSDVIDKLQGTQPPYEIPFKNYEEAIDDEPLLPLLAKNFKRRVADENLYLNIPLTISSTIKSEGFLLPVFSQKTKPSEYLILIDKHNVKSAQVKLFEYLVNRFAKSDVYIETFYFYDKPDYGFNAYYPKGIYITRLYDLYPNHTVIIFGNGYSFFDKYYPALNDAVSLPYTRWNNPVIFTPLPYADWSNKENVLQQRFVLLPADLEGQLLLFNFIDKPETYSSDALQPIDTLYKTKGINVNKAEKIKAYLDDEFLFQWLCALAISPSIHWQTLLGVGDALQRERYQHSIIQYSSLLKLARISWMRDAAFPEEVRLDLLKHLEPLNEKIARQTLIRMMEEAAQKLDEKSFAFEELYLQQLTDKFMLYEHDFNDEEFKKYKKEHDEFKALWKDEKITDVVLKEYLKKEDGGGWSTLIGNANLSNNPRDSVSIDSLFGDDASAAKVKRLKAINSVLLVVISLIIVFTVSLFIFKNQWSQTSLSNKLALISADTNTTIPFTLAMAYNPCLSPLQKQNDSTVVSLHFSDNNLLQLGINDTAIQKNIPYSWLNKQQVQLHVSSRNTEYNFDSTFVLTSNQLSLSINGCTIICNNWKDKKKAILEPIYSGNWYDNSIINGTNTSYKPIHIEPNSINGEQIVNVNSCENNNQLLRVITQTAEGGFSSYYLSQTQISSINFDHNNITYDKLETAEKDTSLFTLSTRIALVSDTNSFAKSNSFFATFNGRWKTDDSADVMDISAAKNIITLDNKYPFTVSAELQAKTTWRRPLYKLSILQNGVAPNKKPFLYVLLLDSTRALISGEEQDSGALHYTIANMGTFQLMHKQASTDAAEKLTKLPQSLNEIWHGGTSNRLMTLFLPKNVIYYSVNDTKTYGTYNINAVSLLSDGTYKIITKTDQGYKLFFIKNVTMTSFDLSVCQDYVATKEEADSKKAADCDHFNTMTLYYENDPSAIYLPVSFSNNLVASQQAKLNKIVTAVNNKTSAINGFDVRLSYTPPNLSNTVNAMNSFLQKDGIINKITNSDVNSSVVNQPFKRSYIQIKTTTTANGSTMPVQTGNNNDVKGETGNEKELGTIQFDARSKTPDAKSLQLIAVVAQQLNKDTASKVKINASYNLKQDDTTVRQYVNTIMNLFRKENVVVSRANKPLQIESSIQMILMPQSILQARTAPSKSADSSKVVHYVSITLTGINFPTNFNLNTNQKAY